MAQDQGSKNFSKNPEGQAAQEELFGCSTAAMTKQLKHSSRTAQQ